MVFKFIYKQRTNGIDRINSNLAHVYLQGSFSFLTQRILLRPTHANRIDVIPHHYLNFYCVLKRVTRIPPRRYIKLQKLEKISQPKSKTMKHWIIPANKCTVIELGRNAREEKVITSNDWNGRTAHGEIGVVHCTAARLRHATRACFRESVSEHACGSPDQSV